MAFLDTDAFELKRMMRQEAHEKAFEIHMFGQRIFEKERDKLVEKGTDNLNREFRDKLNQLNVDQKVEISGKINETRLKRMKKRNDCVEELRTLASAKLAASFASNATVYREVLKKLIIQGMIKLLEDEVDIRVRKEDFTVANSLVPECEKEFTKIMLEKTTRHYETKLTLLKDFLTE
jgi:V-type H+-transporting ATPase subunit E